MTNARTTIVQNILKQPGTGKLLTNRKVSIRLNVAGFINGGTTEVLRTTTVVTDPITAMWSVPLEVNADVDPAGSFYTVQEFPQVIWTFIVPYSPTPLTLRSCLVTAPGNPDPMVAGGDQGYFGPPTDVTNILTAPIISKWGIDAGGHPYYSATGAVASEAAILWIDETGAPHLSRIDPTAVGTIRTVENFTTAAVGVETARAIAAEAAALAAAATINGITISGTPSAGYVPTATSSTAATWQAQTGGGGGAPTGAAGGDLAGTYPNPTLAAAGTAGTYGDATHVAQLTTDAKGRVTGVTPVTITQPTTLPPNGAAAGDLAGTYPNPTLAAAGTAGTYGDATHVPQFTTDAKGRVTAVTPVVITQPTTLPPNGAASGDLTGTYPGPTLAAVATPGTTGDATHSLTVTIDAKGRTTAVTANAIAIPESAVTNLTADLAARWKVTTTGPATTEWCILGPPGGASAGATVNQRLIASPFYLPTTTVFKGLGINVTTAGNAGATIRLGLYNDDGSGRPGTLIAETSAAVAGDAIAAPTSNFTATQTLTPGWYWAASCVQNAATTTPNVTAGNTGMGMLPWVVHQSSIAALVISASGYLQSAVAGALPGTFTTSPALGSISARVYGQIN